MDWSQQCALVIPCLNEAKFIASVVQRARMFLPVVYVVDDGSSDRTAEFASAAGAIVLRHSFPMGKGAALRTGLNQAQKDSFQWAAMMDGDDQHEATDLPAFFEVAEGASLAVGKRDFSRMPRLRRWVNQWMSQRLSALCGCEIPDSQCGFRLLRLDHWAALDIRSSHFEIESEMLVRFLLARRTIRWVPITTRYGSEQSKIHPFRDTLRWFRWLAAIRREHAAMSAPVKQTTRAR